MSWLTFTDADRALAETFRMARLLHAIPTLIDCLVYPDLENTLHIHTQDPKVFASLQLFSRDLQQQAYVVAGVREVCLWNGEEDPVERLSLQSIADMIEIEEPLMVATLERSAMTSETSAMAEKINLPGQTLAAIAEDTEQDITVIRDWCRENGWAIIPFGDQEVVAGEAAIAALDWFGQILIQQRKAKRGLTAIPQPALTNGKMPEPIPEPEPKAESKPAAPRQLALAAGFKTKIKKNNTRANLLAALPVKADIRAEYLNEIVSGSEKGTAFIEKVASVIVEKTGGDKTRMIASLNKTAKAEMAKAA
jgi:hypothetical protein